jgi:hypothetical protein
MWDEGVITALQHKLPDSPATNRISKTVRLFTLMAVVEVETAMAAHPDQVALF